LKREATTAFAIRAQSKRYDQGIGLGYGNRKINQATNIPSKPQSTLQYSGAASLEGASDLP